MDLKRPPGYLANIATVWLRLMAVLLVFYSLISVVYTLVWRPVQGGGAAVVLYTVGALVLWLVSRPLGRLVGRGLDDSGSGPPAV
jgi:hypothetical protein